MDIFIFIVSAIVLYPVLGTLFGILLTLLKFDNLKLKVLLMTVMRPLMYTTLLALIFPSTFNNSLIWMGVFFIAVILRDTFFGLQKYLSKLTVLQNAKISIEYVDSLLRTKKIEIILDDNKHLDLSEMKSLVDYPAALTFAENDNKNRIIILSKILWIDTNRTLNAANKSIAASGA